MTDEIASYYPAWVPFKMEGPEYGFSCPECGLSSVRHRREGETWTTWDSERKEHGLGEQRITVDLLICRQGHEWELL